MVNRPKSPSGSVFTKTFGAREGNGLIASGYISNFFLLGAGKEK
jgi:hypothetical protein